MKTPRSLTPRDEKARRVFPLPVDSHHRPVPSLLREIAGSLFAVFFPADCCLCGQELVEAGWEDICQDCWSGIEPWSGPACARCGLPFASPRALDSAVPLCADCLREEYAFDFARSYGLYTGPLRAAVLQLKFHHRERLGKSLGTRLSAIWESQADFREADRPVLLPVPLHPARKRERGFNQAERLGEGLRRTLAHRLTGAQPRLETRCLRRTRSTVPQTGLSLAARRDNVRGVFEVMAPERIRGRSVVLIDDVMTTGATLSACAGALRRAGAQRVLALTLARATPQFPDAGWPESDVPVDEPGPV